MKLVTIFNLEQSERQLREEEEAQLKQNTKHQRRFRYTLRTYKCLKGCTKRFSSFSSRKYHHHAFHDKTRYGCHWIYCLKTFASKQQWRRHLSKGHKIHPSRLVNNRVGAVV